MRHDTPFLQKPVRLHSIAVKVREVIAPIEFRNCGGVLPETTARPD
jgi:hypothetical protein